MTHKELIAPVPEHFDAETAVRNSAVQLADLLIKGSKGEPISDHCFDLMPKHSIPGARRTITIEFINPSGVEKVNDKGVENLSWVMWMETNPGREVGHLSNIVTDVIAHDLANPQPSVWERAPFTRRGTKVTNQVQLFFHEGEPGPAFDRQSTMQNYRDLLDEVRVAAKPFYDPHSPGDLEAGER